MNIIYSGFDTIVFAVQGAANAESLNHMKAHKELAVKQQSDYPIIFDNGKLRGMIACAGQKGGYAYILKFRENLGHVISVKRNIDVKEWNVYVKIRSLALACYGWEQAVKHVFEDLIAIGFRQRAISLARVDYAIDFLNAGIELSPLDFVAHSRAGKVPNGEKMTGLLRGQTWESVTIGKMPNRQIIVYDKRAEVISKRNPAWFELWKIDKTDPANSVHRVELRAGKLQLQKNEIRTFDDFRTKLKTMYARDVQVVRYVKRPATDTNTSRWPNHPMWDHVQDHVENHMFNICKDVNLEAVKHKCEQQKLHMHTANAIGNLAPVSVILNIEPEYMVEQMVTYVREIFEEVQANDQHSFWKARNRMIR